MTAARTILVPIDFTSASIEALHQARELAANFESRVYLLHVVPDVAQGSPFVEQWPIRGRGLEQDRFASLNQLAVLMVSEQMAPFRTSGIVRRGSVADVITQYALEIHANLIVLGVHRAQPIGRVVEAVTRAARCPVLTIPEQFTSGPCERVAGEFPDAIAC